jgi:hypothetical protein
MESSRLSLSLGERKLILPYNCKFLTIGRSNLADVIVNHSQVSRFHCYIYFQVEKLQEDEVMIYDGDMFIGKPSLNRTFISERDEETYRRIAKPLINKPNPGYIIRPGRDIRLGRKDAPVLKLDLIEDENSRIDRRYEPRNGYIKWQKN